MSEDAAYMRVDAFVAFLLPDNAQQQRAVRAAQGLQEGACGVVAHNSSWQCSVWSFLSIR